MNWKEINTLSWKLSKDAKNVILTPDFKEFWHLRNHIFNETDLKIHKSYGKWLKNPPEESKKIPPISAMQIQKNKLKKKKKGKNCFRYNAQFKTTAFIHPEDFFF